MQELSLLTAHKIGARLSTKFNICYRLSTFNVEYLWKDFKTSESLLRGY